MSAVNRAVALTPRSAVVLGDRLASPGLMMLIWPLLLRVDDSTTRVDPPFLFLALLPLVIAVVLAEVSEGGLDPRVLAILGVLSAVNAILRGVSAGTGGVELVFFLLILAGRVFGPGFGFVLGCTSLFASALLTAGVGPWLPYQMLVAAWVGMGAGLLPRRFTGKAEIAMLVVYGVVSAYAYGLFMNLSGWPFLLGVEVSGHEGSLSYVAGGAAGREPPAVPRLHPAHVDRLSSDTGRAITNAVAILVVLGPAVLTTLRRAARRATVTTAVATDPSSSRQASTLQTASGHDGSMTRIRSSFGRGRRRGRPCSTWSPTGCRRGPRRRCAAGRSRRRRSRSGCWPGRPSRRPATAARP